MAELLLHCERGEGGTSETSPPLPQEAVLPDLGGGAQGRGIAEITACDPRNSAPSSPTDPHPLNSKGRCSIHLPGQSQVEVLCPPVPAENEGWG